MRDAYAAAGGRAELRMFPPVVHDGHRLFADFSGRVKWLRAVDGFLQTHGMPNANLARAEMVMSTTKLAARARDRWSKNISLLRRQSFWLRHLPARALIGLPIQTISMEPANDC
jgi:hypothetical protein